MARDWGAKSYGQWMVKTICWLCGRTYEVQVQVPISHTEALHLTRPAECGPCDVAWKFTLVVQPDGKYEVIEGEQ